MKRLRIILQTVSIAMLMAVNTQLDAASITNLEIETKSQQKVLMLSFLTKGLGEVNIEIIDQNQNVLFTEKVNSGKSIQKKFILDNLEMGNYSLKIEDEFKVTVQPLTVDNSDVFIDREFRKTHFKPQVRLTEEGKYIDLDWLMNETEDAKFIIQAGNSDFSFENKIEDQKLIQKRFDVGQLPKGLYYITVRNNEHTFYETIRIK